MTDKEIQALYIEFSVPESIIKHMRKVAEVCEKLCDELTKSGQKLNKKLITKTAKIHDVLRYVDFSDKSFEEFCNNQEEDKVKTWRFYREKYQKIGHEQAIAKVLKERGQQEMAKIVEKHGIFSVSSLKTLEEKVLFYGDKRVERDKVVSLKKRFEEGRKRNLRPTDDLKKVAEVEAKVYKLEKELLLLCK